MPDSLEDQLAEARRRVEILRKAGVDPADPFAQDVSAEFIRLHTLSCSQDSQGSGGSDSDTMFMLTFPLSALIVISAAGLAGLLTPYRLWVDSMLVVAIFVVAAPLSALFAYIRRNAKT